MQFLDILNFVYDRTGHSQYLSATVPPAEVQRRVKHYVNFWNRKVLSASLMEPLRRVIITKASVADQPTYGVVLNSIHYMTEATNQREIHPRSLGWYRANVPDPARWTGTSTYYVPIGQARIHTRPSVPAQLFIVSTNTNDTGTVKIEVIRSNGYRKSLSKALTGLVPVSLDATITDVIDIDDIRLSVAQTGDVTITEGSGGTELSKIPIGQTYPRFLRFALAPTPSGVLTYTIDGIADIVDLANDYDEPFPNPDFHDILVLGGVYEEWMMRGRGSDARAIRAEIELRLRRLRASILEWSAPPSPEPPRTFDESIVLPIA